MTAVGRVTVHRNYFTCARCGQGDFAADRILGIDGYVTAAAARMACLLGVQQSFARAERALAEVAGWDLDDNTIRCLCHVTAAQAAGGRGGSQRRPRRGTSVTCRRRRCARCWPPWKRRAPLAGAAPAKGSG